MTTPPSVDPALHPDLGTPVLEATPLRLRLFRVSAVRSRLGRRPAAWLSGALLAVIVMACFAVPLARTLDPSTIPLQPPSAAYPFGTDELGRDVFARTFAAGRVDILVAIAAVAVSATLGTLVGCISATIRPRWVDAVIMRVVDALIAFPYVVLVLVVVVIVGPGSQLGPLPRGLTAVLVGLLALGWTFYARLARAQALSLRNREFMVATRVLGFSPTRRLVSHVLPNVGRVMLAYAVSDCIATMTALASFAVLGAGVQQPTPEWGAMIVEGQGLLERSWWISVFPGALLVVVGFNLSVLADALLDEADL